MDYIVLNGIKSNTLKGLLISSLPPITKPLMRTSVETIDGRDGDIVSKLGFSAYDKKLTIGLFGDYDIDAIIKYFTSEGEVIFSNEPDKFYRYEIVSQIDFNKLIRFKTADVTFHVQPFKYSAVDGVAKFRTNMISFADWSYSINGVTVSARDEIIYIKGTASADSEFYLPIDEILLSGQHTLRATVIGSGADDCFIRLIDDYPSLARTFGHASLALLDNDTVSQTADIPSVTGYNVIWINVPALETVDFILTLNMSKTSSNLAVTNLGNTVSKPEVTLYGSGLVDLYLNGTKIFVVNIGASGSIVLDTEKMNAYSGGSLANRQTSGNFNNLILQPGKNTFSWTGNVTQCTVSNYSRWI